MMRARVIAMLVGALTWPAASMMAQQPDLSGEWVFASGSTDSGRGGTNGKTPTRSHTTSGAAFNCGSECRIEHKGSTLTIDNARLDDGEEGPAPAVTLHLDGRPHTVVDSVNRGNTIEAVSRWKAGELLIASTAYGYSLVQTVTLDRNLLVIVTTSSTGAGWTSTLRYTKK